jgi:hypothetical protein
MEIELYSILSTIIVAATAVTVLFALLSYVRFRVKQRASLAPPPQMIEEPAPTLPEPEFFRPYAPKRLR